MENVLVVDCQNKITFRKFKNKYGPRYSPTWRLLLNGKIQREYYIFIIGRPENVYGLSICVIGEQRYFNTLIEAKRALAIIFNNERKYELKMPL